MWIFISKKAIFIKVLGPKWHRKDILRTKSKKIILNSKSAALNTSLCQVSFKTNVSLLKLSKKSIFGMKFRKMKSPSTLVYVIVKHLQVLGHCES